MENINEYERRNDGISVNVFEYNSVTGNTEGPHYPTREEKETDINLFLFEKENLESNEDEKMENVDEEERVIKSHYVWIKTISR